MIILYPHIINQSYYDLPGLFCLEAKYEESSLYYCICLLVGDRRN